MRMQHRPRALARGFRALQQLSEQRGSPDHGMATPLGEGRNDHWRPRSTVRFEDAFDRRHADVWEIDRPNEHGARPHRLEGAQSSSEGRDGAGFRLRVLHDDAIVASQHRLNTGGVWPKDDHSRLYLERFQSLQDSHDERETEEIQQGFGRANSGRPASRQHDAR